MLFLFLVVVLSLLSIWDEMDVCVKLIVDDVWAAEDDKTGLFTVVIYQLYLKELLISLSIVPMSTIKLNYEK